MEKKGVLGLGIVKAVILAFIFLAVVAVVTIMVSFELQELDTFKGTASQIEYFLSDNGMANTLSQTPVAWTSATTINNSWLSFDGVNDYINFPVVKPLSQIMAENFTFTIWINSSQNDGRNAQLIKTGAGGISGLYIKDIGNISWHHVNDSNDFINVTGKPINDSEWHLITLNGNGTGFNLSIDATDSYFTDGGLLKLATKYTLDSLSQNTNDHLGYLDEFRWYNRSLSLTEISEIYASGRLANKSLPTTGLIFWLPLNENTGTDVHSLNHSDF